MRHQLAGSAAVAIDRGAPAATRSAVAVGGVGDSAPRAAQERAFVIDVRFKGG